MLGNFLLGASVLFSGINFIILIIGVIWGLIAGALPGVTASIGLALILPFTFSMEASTGMILLSGTFAGAMFGGCISTVLLGAPGTASAAATLEEGRALYKQGKAGIAVGTGLFASVIGGMFASVILILVATSLAKVALAFGPPEFFAVAVLGLTVLTTLSDEILKCLISGLFGLMLATIGIEPFVGISRFTFGSSNLIGGLEFLAVLIGIFAITEVFKQSRRKYKPGLKNSDEVKARAEFPDRPLLRKLSPSIILGSVLGTVIGILPGAGGTIGSWVSYGQAKLMSKEPEKFGKGSLEGIAAPEAANSASNGGSLVPLLSLGIPGSNPTAVMLGALMLQGITPGPNLFVEHPDIIYSLYIAVFLANFIVLFFGMITLPVVLKIVKVPFPVINSILFILVCSGAFSIRNNLFDVGVAVVFGLIGYVMWKYNFTIPAVVLGLILGPIIETNLRRSLILSRGNIDIFFTRPISATILIVAIITLLFPVIRKVYLAKNRG